MTSDAESDSTPRHDTPLYESVVTRRLQWDNLLWQVPVLSFTAQAFLFTISLGADSSQYARIVASVLSLVIAVLSIHLMARHRQAEVTDAEWIEEYENGSFGRSFHGKEWQKARNKQPKGGLLAQIRPAFAVWMTGMSIFAIISFSNVLIACLRPDLFVG